MSYYGKFTRITELGEDARRWPLGGKKCPWRYSRVVVGDVFGIKTDLWNLLNNRQKVSVNLLTDGLLRIEKIEGKDVIVMDVPRADRTSRPVYCGMDPRSGSYRRNGEGDYHCTLEEVSAMFRDAALVPQDAKVLQEKR